MKKKSNIVHKRNVKKRKVNSPKKSDPQGDSTVRLNKFIADSGIASRRKAEEYIVEGRVSVNGKTVIALSTKVDPIKDTVTIDGERIKQEKPVYYLLYKPKGCVSTTSDEKKRRTVLDYIKTKARIYPVGRLDYNTSGVLLLTNDGDFTNLLLHPSNGAIRKYEVKLDRSLSADDEAVLLKGVYLQDGKGKFDAITFPKNTRRFLTVETREGRNHFVKNLFSALSYIVTELHRISIGGFTTEGLQKGAFRQLSKEEVERVYEEYS